MIVILEGFDEAGKSTLAAKLQQKLGWQVIHPGPRPKTHDETHEMCINQRGIFNYASQLNIIFDRVTCISSYAYGNKPTSTYIDELIKNENILLVACKSYNSPLKTSENDDEASVKYASEHVDEIKNEYLTVFSNFNKGNIFYFDYKDHDSFYNLLKRIGFDKIS